MISPSVAIDYLLDPIGKRDIHDDAIELAVDALRKQIPKDAYTVWDTSFGCHKPQCPVCMATNPRMTNYCCNCGQALSNTDV